MPPRLPTPPRLRGLPLLGVAPAFRRDPVDTLRRAHGALGPVFAFRLGPLRAAALGGPRAGRAFFAQPDEALALAPAYRFLVPMFGRTLQAAGGETYRRHRAVLQPAFAAERMPGYVRVMAEETTAWLDALGESGTLELRGAMEALTLRIAAAALMGQEFRRRFGERFARLYADLAGGMEFILPPRLPLPRFRRRDRARAALHALLGPLVADRRDRPRAHGDFLAGFAAARGDDGALLPLETATDLALLLVFAAYETTSAQLSWALVALLNHPAWLARVLEERGAVVGPREEAAADPDTLRALERLGWSLRESERLTPATTLLMRHVQAELEVEGYRVPAGWKVVTCPAVAHRSPDAWERPDAYDPERFGRGEGHVPGALAAFGGGAHRCPGFLFAQNEMKVILTLLLGRYSLELVDGDVRPDYRTGLTRPRSPCRVRYRRRR